MRAVQIANRHRAIDHIIALVGGADRVILVDVEFVGDFADDLFQDVFERD